MWVQGLPASFCEKHLPLKDTSITLETQSKKLYKAKYLVRKAGLSGGWKGFAICERLFVGDVLVFHLVSAAKFKVIFLKAYLIVSLCVLGTFYSCKGCACYSFKDFVRAGGK